MTNPPTPRFGGVRAPLLILGLCLSPAAALQSQAQTQCKPFIASVSSGGWGISGNSAVEVCQQLAQPGPTGGFWRNGPVNGSEYRTVTVKGAFLTGPNNFWLCQTHVETVNVVTGKRNDSESGDFDYDGVVGPVCRYVDLYFDRPKENSCPVRNPKHGNPIYPLTGVKTQTVDLGIWIGGEQVQLTYDTRWRLPGAVPGGLGAERALSSFGPLVHTNLHKSLMLQSVDSVPGRPDSAYLMQRGGGVVASATTPGFDRCGGGGRGGSSYQSAVYPNQKVEVVGASRRLSDGDALLQEEYGDDGTVRTVSRAGGGRLTYVYSDAGTDPAVAPVPGLLIRVEDQFGRTVRFDYEQPADLTLAPRVVRVVSSDGQLIQAAYGAGGFLASLTWADGTVRRFVQERGDLPWAMTGIVDENGRRHATYTYDADGRVIGSELTGAVDRYTVSWGTPGAWIVTELTDGFLVCREHRWRAPSGTRMQLPRGEVSNLDAGVRDGMVSLNSKSQPAGSGCSASASAQDYDDQGNVKQYDDFNGTRTCFDYDIARKLRTVTLEGVPSSTACPASLTGHVPSGQQRMTTTAWHPDWVLEVKRAEPGRITTSIYNGQPDPFNGGVAASCAPGTAVLPDGKPLALLCRQVQQATTDNDGHLGFGAKLKAGVSPRQTTWTYNQYGQVLTEDGPRNDLQDVTRYEYYADTTADYTLGDLKQVTDSAGHQTRYTKYNKAGKVLEAVDANGVITVNTYDARQRMLSSITAGRTTAYDYDAVGQLKKVTSPVGSWIGYDYDDAHRQVAVYDHKGNRIDYVLDSTGQRIAERAKDPGGNLRRHLARSIDALGRVQQTTGRE